MSPMHQIYPTNSSNIRQIHNSHLGFLFRILDINFARAKSMGAEVGSQQNQDGGFGWPGDLSLGKTVHGSSIWIFIFVIYRGICPANHVWLQEFMFFDIWFCRIFCYRSPGKFPKHEGDFLRFALRFGHLLRRCPPSARRLFSSCSALSRSTLQPPMNPSRNRAKPGETKCWFSATMWIIHVNYEHLINGQRGQ